MIMTCKKDNSVLLLEKILFGNVSREITLIYYIVTLVDPSV